MQFVTNYKHKGIYHKSLNLIIPEIMPPVKEPPDAKETIHFFEIYEDFDPHTLDTDQLIEFAKDLSVWTGYDIGETYTVDGVTKPLPPYPLEDGFEKVNRDLLEIPLFIRRYEKLWLKGTYKDAYMHCRSTLSDGIRAKTLEMILLAEERVMTPSQRAEMRSKRAEYDHAFRMDMQEKAERLRLWR